MDESDIILYLMEKYEIIINDYYDKTYFIKPKLFCDDCIINKELYTIYENINCNCFNDLKSSSVPVILKRASTMPMSATNKYITITKYNLIKLIPEDLVANNINENLLNYKLCEKILNKLL